LTNYYNEIKNELLNYEVTKKVKEYSINKSELETKYNVGKMLIEAQGGEERAKYGNSLIKEYSTRLTKEIGKGYSEQNLKEMRQYYLYIKKGRPVGDNLNWSHYRKLMTIDNNNAIKYYICQIKLYNLSKRQLEEKIKSKEYERLSEETKNKLSLDSTCEYEITDFVKNPIIIKNTKGDNNITEKVLQKLILEDLDNFLLELGEGFTYIANEYKIKMDNTYNYIDLLLFNYIYNAFVVVELKTTKLEKEHIGQIEVYMNYIDENIKTIYQNKTIGIIIAKEGNKYVMKYCSDPRIYNTTYIFN